MKLGIVLPQAGVHADRFAGWRLERAIRMKRALAGVV
jgi:hypothetical protein